MSAPPASASRSALVADLSRYALLVLCFYFVAAYGIAALGRLPHPYELEWLEGSHVDHVARVAAGEPLYVAPTVDFVPHATTPFFYWIAAALTPVLGIGFLPLRLVSFAASLGCLAVLFRFVERETADRHAALAAAAIFAATYPLSGHWLDLARVDSLALLFVLIGALGLRGPVTRARQALAGVAFAAAFFTWQVALLVIVPLCVHAALAGRGLSRAVFPVTSVGLVGVGCGLGLAVSDGWFAHYVFALPQSALGAAIAAPGPPFETADGGPLFAEAARTLPVIGLLALAFAVPLIARRRGRDASFFVCLAIGLLGASWAEHALFGAAHNALLPACAALALLAGLSIHELPRLAAARRSARSATWAQRVAIGVHVACVVQLAALLYDPTLDVPGPADVAAGERRVGMMRQADGEIWSPAAGHLPRLAGKRPTAHMVPLHAVVAAGGPVGQTLAADVERALAEKRFAVVFAKPMGFTSALRDHYSPTRMGPSRDDASFPRGASVARSREIYLPRVR